MLSVQNISTNLKNQRLTAANKAQYTTRKMYLQPMSDKVSFGNFPHNFAEVIPNKLFRGALPNWRQLEYLKNNKSLKYVVDFSPSKTEKAMVEELEMNYVPVRLAGDDEEDFVSTVVSAAKKIAELLDGGPVFAHCEMGQKRTGYVIAVCQKLIQKLSDEEIINNASKHGNDSIGDLLRLIKSSEQV